MFKTPKVGPAKGSPQKGVPRELRISLDSDLSGLRIRGSLQESSSSEVQDEWLTHIPKSKPQKGETPPISSGGRRGGEGPHLGAPGARCPAKDRTEKMAAKASQRPCLTLVGGDRRPIRNGV